MNPEPRHQEDYSPRQVEAAHRVLVDVGQVLASFAECFVVVGGWIPDLLLSPDEGEPHVGSVDVDLALNVKKLSGERYAELVQSLLATHRYRKGAKDFQLVVDVDLQDGEKPVQVEVEFIAPKGAKMKKHKPKLLEGFRVLQTEACEAAFHAPKSLPLKGKTVHGAENTVRLLVASLPDFLVMKAHAIAGRDKPKDSYDFCYGLDHFPLGMEALAAEWKRRLGEKDVAKAVGVLREKFASLKAFGPQQLVEFHNSSDPEIRSMQARRAYELVQKLLSLL